MTKLLKTQIVECRIITYNASQICIKSSRISDSLMLEILEATRSCRDSLSERLYWIMNDISNYPYCRYCNKQFYPRFFGHKIGYRNAECCSLSCNNKSEKHKRQIMFSYLFNYGVSHSSQNPAHQQKLQNICLEKYGTTHFFQATEIKDKIKKTTLKKYGVENVSQDFTIFQKSQKHRTKVVHLPSGKPINYQGYELTAILELLKTFPEEEIINSRTSIPKIRYTIDRKNKVYYPDIFIPSLNKIIEVKSHWTYEKYINVNIAKAKASIKAGYDFEFWICNNKTVLEILKI